MKVLYKNLFFRFFKTKAFIMLIAFLLILISAFPLFAQKSDEYYKISFDPYYIEERYKADTDLQNMIWEADREDAPDDIYETIYKLKVESVFYNSADKFGLDIYNEPFIADTLHDYAALTVEKNGAIQNSEIFQNQEALDTCTKILTDHDFELYTKLQNEKINASQMSPLDKELKIYENDLYLLSCKNGEYIRPEIKTAVNTSLQLKKSIIEKKDYYLMNDGRDLSQAEVISFENELSVYEYRIENSFLAPENSVATPKLAIYLFEVFLIIYVLASANSFIIEQKDGTCRFYLSQYFTRRSYFYVSLLTVVSISAIFTVISYLISLIGCYAFSPDFALPYITLSGAEISAMPFALNFALKFILMYFKVILLYSFCLLFAELIKAPAVTNAITVIIFALDIIKNYIISLAQNKLFMLFDPAESMFPFDFGNKFILSPSIVPLIFVIVFSALLMEFACRVFEMRDFC